MSRRRQGTDPSDSLELLLDTISNVFGAIILMAILVVLQAQATAMRIPKQDPDASERTLEERKLAFEESRLAAKLDALRKENPLPNPTESQKALTLDERRRAFEEAIAQAERQLEQVRQTAKRNPERVKELDEAIAAVGRQLLDEHRKLSDLKRTGVVSDPTAHKIRLPFRHNRNRFLRQRQFLVQDGHVWPLPERCTASPVPRSSGRLYSPMKGRGLRVPLPGQAATEILSLMSGRTPRSHFISFWVCDTSASFESFQRLRALFVEQGYEYSVGTFPERRGLILYPGTPQVE